MRDIARQIAYFLVIAALWLADALIWVMLRTRTNERRIRPTLRVSWRRGLKQELMRRQDNTCVYCGTRRQARSLDVDHIVPVVRGGSNDESNLQVICRACNLRKGIQTDAEFRTRYSRLVPQRRLTAPRRQISQAEFRAETQRTSQGEYVRQFRRTRFISKREKVVGGCALLGVVIAILVAWGLASLGADGLILLLPTLMFGGATGGGVFIRAYRTGAMFEDE